VYVTLYSTNVLKKKQKVNVTVIPSFSVYTILMFSSANPPGYSQQFQSQRIHSAS
jgi:hypothetical protein